MPQPSGYDALTEQDARCGGFADLDALRGALAGRGGQIFRIGLVFEREDPRLALREDTSPASVATVLDKLRAKDRRAAAPWTRPTLEAIAAHPERRAADIAADFGLDKPTFKRRVRQLKELGLTISLSPGYRLSPRGLAVLEALRKA